MASNSFFNEQTEQSLVKATIVAKYFSVWANVIISTHEQDYYRKPEEIRESAWNEYKKTIS